MSEHRPSKRFAPTKLAETLIPIILILLVLVLLTVFIVIGLSMAGVIPAK